MFENSFKLSLNVDLKLEICHHEKVYVKSIISIQCFFLSTLGGGNTDIRLRLFYLCIFSKHYEDL